MHATRLLGTALMSLVLALPAWGQAPNLATVVLPEVDVRSGPTLQYYVTSKLLRGQQVEVVREQAGFLAIKPPPGSFDLIDARNVQTGSGSFASVIVDDADVLIGSPYVDQLPTSRGEKQKRGAQLFLLGRSSVVNGVTWLAVSPPPQEVRWIPREAIGGTQQIQATATPMAPPPSNPPVTLTGNLGNLLAQAEQAEREGRLPQAYQFYADLAAQRDLDADTRIRVVNKMMSIYRIQTQPGAVAYADNRAFATPTAAPVQPAQAFSQYGAPAPQPTTPAMRPMTAAVTGPGGYPQTATPVGTQQLQQSGPGQLIRTSQRIQGQPAYRLLNASGNIIMYVTPPPKFSLDQYVGRNVNVLGLIVYDNQLRTNHMTAQHVYLLD